MMQESERERYFAAILVISEITGMTPEESHGLVDEFLQAYEITEVPEFNEKLH